MESSEGLVESLRARLREVERQLINLHALKQEQASLINLIRVYERKQSSLIMLPDVAQSEDERSESLASLPRMMALASRIMLQADIGPSATVPQIFVAFPPSVQRQYGSENLRSNIETLRTQIITWQSDAGLVYEKGGIVSVAPGTPEWTYPPNGLVLRSGIYRCTTHDTWKEPLNADGSFAICPHGGPDCRWIFDSPLPQNALSSSGGASQ